VSAAPTGLSATISGNSLIVSNTAAAQGSYPLTLTATGPGGTATTTVTVTVPAVIVPVAGDFSFKLDPSELTLAAGQTTAVSTLVTPSGDFKGDVVYSVSGAPAGLTATVRGATLSFTNVNAATGTSTLTVTATSGTLVHTALLRVTTQAAVPPPPGTPDFVLNATPSTLSLATGAQGTVAVSTNPINNFNAALTYSVSGAPAGLTATISGTTLTVKNTSAAPGSYPLALSATGGGVTHGTTVVVTVPGVPTTTPDFTMNLTPNALTLAQGQSGSSSASAAPTNGFTGNVSYSVSGAPAGLQAAFNGATLTVTNASAAAGSYALTVTGTSGTLTHTTTLTVQVPTVNTPPASDATIRSEPSDKLLPENGSVSYQLYYAQPGDNSYKPDLTRPYTGMLEIKNLGELTAKGYLTTQQNGKITVKDNGQIQPGGVLVQVKPSGASDDKIDSAGILFAVANSAKVVNTNAVALDNNAQSFATYTITGNNIGGVESNVERLPYEMQNGAVSGVITEVTPGPRNRTLTLKLGFGFASFDTSPLKFDLIIHFRDGTTGRVPVTLQYQSATPHPVDRYPSAIHSRSAPEQAAIDELNAIRASGTCGGKSYGSLPPVRTDERFDNGNREYAGYSGTAYSPIYDRDRLRLYLMLNGYLDDSYNLGHMQYAGTYDSPNGSDGRSFIQGVEATNCEAFMSDASIFLTSVVFFPRTSNASTQGSGGYWSFVLEAPNR